MNRPGDAARAIERERHEAETRRRHAAARRKAFVLDTEMTPEELLERHRQMKAEFLERQARRAAA